MREISTISNVNELLSGSENFKVLKIREIINLFPSRKFLLIGDSGEKDPEVYSQILSNFPENIVGIWIRDVTGETKDNQRYKELFPGESTKLLRIFKNITELPNL